MARASKRTAGPLPKIERLLLYVVGGVLLAIGMILPALIMPSSLTGYLRTQDEVSVEARIEALDRIRTGKRTSSTQVRYFYRHLGNDYEFSGTEVALFGESDGLYPRLHSAHNAGRPIRVWIDPEEPSFSVIERNWHWPTMTAAIAFFGGFSVMGGTLIRFARRGLRRS